MAEQKQKEAVIFVITGAAGQIGYSLIPLVASGQVLGADQPVILHLLDIEPSMKTLQGVCMEIDDCAYPLVEGVVATADANLAFKGANYAILVGGFPRKPGMERKDLLARNSPIFIGQGKAINDNADPNIKVLVVANPANTNCLVTATNAPKIPKENFSALTRLDQNRAVSQLATKLGVGAKNVTGVTIWGNHSSTMVVDASQATSKGDKVTDKLDAAWLDGDFSKTVQKRGGAVIAARGLSSAASAANAAKDHMRDWVQGTAAGTHVSMGVFTQGQYGVEKGLMFSLPVTCQNGAYTVKEGIEWSPAIKEGVAATQAELMQERVDAGLV